MPDLKCDECGQFGNRDIRFDMGFYKGVQLMYVSPSATAPKELLGSFHHDCFTAWLDRKRAPVSAESVKPADTPEDEHRRDER